MNIFVLDQDSVKAAQYQCNKHVVKMILETAQLLCSVFPEGRAPYKKTHCNHPCAKWTRESLANYIWLVQHGYALCHEYRHRYNKQHKSLNVIDWCVDNIDEVICLISNDSNQMTPFPKCMPDDCKVEDVVDSYRNYYIKHKKDIAKWSNREIPHWWK